jgi:hypothetical protein
MNATMMAYSGDSGNSTSQACSNSLFDDEYALETTVLQSPVFHINCAEHDVMSMTTTEQAVHLCHVVPPDDDDHTGSVNEAHDAEDSIRLMNSNSNSEHAVNAKDVLSQPAPLSVLLELPDDIARIVVYFLDVSSIQALCQTCRYDEEKAQDVEKIQSKGGVRHHNNMINSHQQLFSRLHKRTWAETAANLQDSSRSASSNPSILEICHSEWLWAYLVEQRFAIPTVNSHSNGHTSSGLHRPRTYGGATWKLAFASLVKCHRIPRSKVTTKRKTIFAKTTMTSTSTGSTSPSSSSAAADGVVACDGLGHGHVQQDASCSCWVTLGHSEDCRVRVVGSGTNRRRRRRRRTEVQPHNDITDTGLEPPVGTRYVELHVCFQLTSSTASQMEVDMAEAFVELAHCEHGTTGGTVLLEGSMEPRIIHRGMGRTNTNNNNKDDRHGGRRQPPLTSSSSSALSGPSPTAALMVNVDDDDDLIGTACCSDNTDTSTTTSRRTTDPIIISLQPLEFVVVAINVTCSSNMVFETDFLSRAMAVHVPCCATKHIELRPKPCRNAVPCKKPHYDVSQVVRPEELYNLYVHGVTTSSSLAATADHHGNNTNARAPISTSTGTCLSALAGRQTQSATATANRRTTMIYKEPRQRTLAKVPLKWIKVLRPGWMVATFIPEHEIMSCYMEMPGRVMALAFNATTAMA